MVIALSPASSTIQKIIAADEIPLRSRFLPEEVVRKVFRHGAIVGSRIETFQCLERGMNQARQLIGEYEGQGRSFPSGLVILAEQLTGGKGRFQRFWHAPEGGIWLTLILVNTLLPEYTRFYPLAAGMACCEAINLHVPPARIKWVNDVHVGGKKLCGVLAETLRGKASGEEYILIGAGINVNNEVFPQEIAPLAASLKSVTGRTVDMTDFASRLLAKFSWHIGLLQHLEEEALAAGGYGSEIMPPAMLLEKWLGLSDTVGRRVVFGYDVQQNPQYRAEVLGMDSLGGLILKNLEDDSVITEYSGEIIYLD